MPTLAPVIIRIGGRDDFSKTFRPVARKLKKTGDQFSAVGKKMSTNLTLPILGVGAAIIKTAATFEASMNKVEALTGASGDQLLKMKNVAQELGATTKFSATEAADAMAFLGMAGWQTNQIMEGLPGVLDLAAASNTDLAQAADIASNVMGAFGIDASNAGDAADILAAATSSANVDMSMIAETMKDAAPIAKQFGATLKDTATLTGFLGNIGIQGSKAGTALKNIFLTLSAPPAKAQKWFDKLGVSTKDMNGELKPVPETFAELGQSLQKLPRATRLEAINAIFGKIPIASAAALADDLGKSNSEFQKLASRMVDTKGKAKSMANIMNKGAVGAFNQMKAAAEAVAIAIADSGLLQFVTEMALGAAKIFQKISKASPALLKFGTILAGILAVLGPAAMFIGSLVSGIGSLMAAITAAGGAAAIALNPITLIIAAIIAAITSVIVVGKNMENRFGKMMFAVFAFTGPMLAAVSWIISRWDKLMPYFKLFAIGIGKIFTGLAEGPLGRFFSWIGDKIAWVGDMLAKLLDSVVFGVLGKIAGTLFSDEDLAAVGLNSDGSLKDTGADKAKLQSAVSAQTGTGKRKDELEVKITTDPGTQADVIKQKGDAKMSVDTGPTMAGAF